MFEAFTPEFYKKLIKMLKKDNDGVTFELIKSKVKSEWIAYEAMKFFIDRHIISKNSFDGEHIILSEDLWEIGAAYVMDEDISCAELCMICNMFGDEGKDFDELNEYVEMQVPDSSHKCTKNCKWGNLCIFDEHDKDMSNEEYARKIKQRTFSIILELVQKGIVVEEIKDGKSIFNVVKDVDSSTIDMFFWGRELMCDEFKEYARHHYDWAFPEHFEDEDYENDED